MAARSAVLEVADLSLAAAGSDAGGCRSDPLHAAVCGVVAAGVVVVAAAGNEASDAAGSVPAAYDEVVTASALADSDGRPGGRGGATCTGDGDDTFADFSNLGRDVDLVAPGVCVRSTWRGGTWRRLSGTSMAAPHVAGAVALHRARHPGTAPGAVRAALRAAGSSAWDGRDDPDGRQEPLLLVRSF